MNKSNKHKSDKNSDVHGQERAWAARWAVLEAGKITLNYFRGNCPAEMKPDDTPVTVADREAEMFLRKALAKRFPGDGFLGEEYGDQTGTTGYRWIIDPIDATKNFVRGIPFFATLVGLEFEGEAIAGIAHVPCLDLLYHAVKGHGAFRNGTAIAVSDRQTLKDSVVIYSSLDWYLAQGPAQTAFFHDLVRDAGRMRGFGDFMGFLLVADGSADVMLEPEVGPWDVAALKPIIEEAGGVFTDWTGKPTIYGQGAIVGTPAIHHQILERANAATAKGK